MALVASEKYLADMDSTVLSQRGFQVGDEVICDESRISYNKNCRNILYERQGGTPLFAKSGTFIIEPYTILRITGLSVEPGDEVFATLETADHVALDLPYNTEYLAHADKWLREHESIVSSFDIKRETDRIAKKYKRNIIVLSVFKYLAAPGAVGFAIYAAGLFIGRDIEDGLLTMITCAVLSWLFISSKTAERSIRRDKEEETLSKINSQTDVVNAAKEQVRLFHIANGYPGGYNESEQT
jgi:hypothetical protein